MPPRASPSAPAPKAGARQTSSGPRAKHPRWKDHRPQARRKGGTDATLIWSFCPKGTMFPSFGPRIEAQGPPANGFCRLRGPQNSRLPCF